MAFVTNELLNLSNSTLKGCFRGPIESHDLAEVELLCSVEGLKIGDFDPPTV